MYLTGVYDYHERHRDMIPSKDIGKYVIGRRIPNSKFCRPQQIEQHEGNEQNAPQYPSEFTYSAVAIHALPFEVVVQVPGSPRLRHVFRSMALPDVSAPTLVPT